MRCAGGSQSTDPQGIAERAGHWYTEDLAGRGRGIPGVRLPQRQRRKSLNNLEFNHRTSLRYLCGKGPRFGNNISHAHNVTRRRWNVNLQSVKALVNGSAKRMRVCATCIKGGKVAKA